MKPVKVDDIDVAYGPLNLGELLPPYKFLPHDFVADTNEYCKIVGTWFYKGMKKTDLVAKEGIDANDAWRHMMAVMASFEIQHEHKIAGVAYLMSQWFDIANKA